MEFTITAQNGDSVKIEAENWMLAMGKAMTFFQVDTPEVGRLICNPGADGSVFIDNPTGERSWMVRRVEQKITVVAAAASASFVQEPAYSEPPSLMEDPPTVELSATPPPALSMPVTSSLHKVAEEVESLAERLFDLSMEISMASPDEACKMALDLIHEFVAVEAASVARGTINDPELRFVAATGPVADQIIGRSLHFGEGLIGMCFDMGGTLVVNDVESETRHVDHFDQETGFETLCALCVPIVDDESMSFGVIQLLNPSERRFSPENVEAVETIARTLAGSLRTQV